MTKILKPGQIGHGILIEYDSGHISPKDNQKFINEIKKLDSGQRIIEEPLVLYAVLQKCGVENRNGRIYPREILEREARNYQKIIQENRALGECVPAGTEILTKNGWVNIETVTIGDEIYTLNLDNNQIEIQPIQNTIKKPYSDDLVHIYNKSSLDMKLTKNHKMVLWDRYENQYEMTAIEFHDQFTQGNENVINSKFYIDGKRDNIDENISKSFDGYINQESKTLDEKFNVELEKFNDNVYCVSVPNKTWLMRYNNKVAWTHNCDHPESSIISVDRISHNITEIWWEGNTLLGKLEVLMSPGFINYGIISCQGDQIANLIRKGIMIGVSSRGVGSLDKKDGKNYVQEDFELICWDVVTSPSTPGSWIFNRKEESAPFVESTNTKKPLIIDSLDNFLNDNI
jgi:hypothetical protein